MKRPPAGLAMRFFWVAKYDLSLIPGRNSRVI